MTDVVLVVEDEVLIRMVIADYLRTCGYRVIEAASADEALVILQHTEFQVDVVFSDIEMPGSMDGFALSKWLRANRPGVLAFKKVLHEPRVREALGRLGMKV